MSTVDKATADAIMAGKYADDRIEVIIRYENSFNGNFAYKIVDYRKNKPDYIQYLLETLDGAELIWSQKS